METACFPLESRNRLQRVAQAFDTKEVTMTKMVGHKTTVCIPGMQKSNFTVGMDPFLSLLVLFLIRICL